MHGTLEHAPGVVETTLESIADEHDDAEGAKHDENAVPVAVDRPEADRAGQRVPRVVQNRSEHERRDEDRRHELNLVEDPLEEAVKSVERVDSRLCSVKLTNVRGHDSSL